MIAESHPAPAAWRKSSYSGGNDDNCVEVAQLPTSRVGIRDSKNPHGPILEFEPERFAAFLGVVKSGAFEICE